MVGPAGRMGVALSGQSANAGRAADAAQRGGGNRALIALVVLLLVAFAAALIMQVDSRRRATEELAIQSQTASALVLAERVNANLAQAWGASAGAAEMAGRTDAIRANPSGVAIAASRARPVRGAAVFDSEGRLAAITDPDIAQLAAVALQAAQREAVWANTVRTREGETAPVIVRRTRQGTIVSVINTDALLVGVPSIETTMIAAQSGAVLFASERLRALGPNVQATWLAALGDGAVRQTGAVLEDASGAWAIGAATTSIADLRIVVATPAMPGLMLLLQSIMQFALLAGAPLAAVGALLLLLSQNEKRVKLAEAEAERAEAQFKLAADSARAGVFEWRSDEDTIALSEQAAAMLHSPQDTMPLAEFAELPLQEDRAAVDEELRRARRTGALDLRFRVSVGGQIAFIEVRGVAIEDRAVRGPVRFIGSVLDVTPRHTAELRVTRLEHQLRAAIDSFSGPFALWDQRKRLMLWNQAYVTAFQLAPETVRARASYESIAAAAAPQIRRERVHPVDPQIREIELANGEWLQVVERRTSDGGLVTIGIDITAIKRQEEALKRNDKRHRDLISRLEQSEDRIRRQARDVEEARQRAEEASKAKSAFLANMSHELRTPLTHIIGFSEIMGKELFGPIGSEQYRQYANDIHGSGNHLLDLINDILDMAKIEAGKVQLSPRPLDPMEAIETAVRLTRRRADEKGLQIIVDAQDMPEIEADHRAVKQMLINLLSNAIKFTDEGAVMVRGRRHREGVMLRVADTGCGIPPEQLPRLAKPFEQVETELSRNHSGTGLGLALSKSLAEMHGGELTIESELGKGTIVSIYLPRAFAGVALPEAAE
ncbi:MAG: hypothetical protein GC206_11485 [Alphaproteobacteria bacterium]|nr:hypothetical protein [Alphaproteobacteria bacterium]